MKKIVVFIILVLFLFSCDKKETKPYLIILSMDGCRWDYPDMYAMPTLDSIASVGVKSVIKPSFPTKTFPNHYTMATGLYPGNSGIVGNTFYNPEIDNIYKVSDRSTVEDPRFYEGEPFWCTAEKQGVMSASYFWVGSETKIQGIQPSIWKTYTSESTPEMLVDSVISWLKRPEELRPHLISFYFYQPDRVGHHFGPESIETKKVMQNLDSVLNVLCHQLNELDISKEINLIITSDHGMGAIDSDRVIYLSEVFSDDEVEYCLGSNPFYLIEPKAENGEELFQRLSAIEGITVWAKDEVPDRLHYTNSSSIASLVLVADSSWSVFWEKPRFFGSGTHGYDNCNSDMNAIFYGYGPAFKVGYEHPTFPNVDLYPLMMEIMELEPADTDGDVERVRGLLID